MSAKIQTKDARMSCPTPCNSATVAVANLVASESFACSDDDNLVNPSCILKQDRINNIGNYIFIIRLF